MFISKSIRMEEIDTYQNEVRVCKDCGLPLDPGREDRQYCDTASKTNYNNRRRKALQTVSNHSPELSIPDYIGRIQDILINNRRILEQLCDEDRVGRIRMRDLIGRGFNLKFYTSETEPTGSGNVYRFCFEYGYREDENGTVIVICRKREVA
jgi:hypothetical protein